MRLRIIIPPPLPLISMTCLPILPQTKLTCQSSNLLLSCSSVPYSSFVSAVVAVVFYCCCCCCCCWCWCWCWCCWPPGLQRGLGLRIAVRAEKAKNVHRPRKTTGRKYNCYRLVIQSCPYAVCCDTDGHCFLMSNLFILFTNVFIYV